MRAIAVNEWGGRDALELLDVEPPPVAPDGVLVRVRAAALNPVDYKVREGKLAGGSRSTSRSSSAGTPPGVVEEVGPGGHLVQARRPGLRLLPPARPRVRHLRRVHDRPGGLSRAYAATELSFEEAAAMPLAALTAHQALELLGLRGGETLFVTGGAGGVGHFAIQLAIARGARVIATGSPAATTSCASSAPSRVDYHDPRTARARARAHPRRRRRRRVRPLRRRRAGAGVRRAAPRRAARLDRRAAGAARALRDPLHLRAPERLRPRRAHHAARRTRAACARTSPRRSRSRRPPRPTSGSRTATCAASSCSRSPTDCPFR